MLLLAIALAATPAALPAEPQRHAKTRVVRHSRARARLRTSPTVFALPIVVPRDRNAKYRVTDTDQRIDFKTRVVERPTFQNCGVTGMPVCPSKGMPVLKSED